MEDRLGSLFDTVIIRFLSNLPSYCDHCLDANACHRMKGGMTFNLFSFIYFASPLEMICNSQWIF
jgi:hypothetical protein